MTHTHTIHPVLWIVFIWTLLLNIPQVHGQSLCTGLTGTPIVFKDFGTGTTQYSTKTPADYNFSTTYWQKFAGEKTNDSMFSFQNKVNDDFNVWLPNIVDHTSGDGKGYLMLVNADYKPGEFYRDTVNNLCIGSSYNFSVFLGNVFRPNLTSTLPNVIFEIRSVTDGSLLATSKSGPIPTMAAFTWKQYGMGFTSPATSVVLLMVSNAPGGVGSDIAIDDISFTPCVPATTAIDPIKPVCNDGPADIKVRVYGNGDYKYYQWQTSKDNGVTWTSLGPSGEQTSNSADYTVNLAIAKVSATDNNTTYRMIVGTSAASLSDLTSNCKAFVYSQTTLLKILDPVTITFPAIPALCANSATVNLNTTTPSGGTFSGTPNVTSAGVFNPSSVGSFKVVYTVVNSQGCSDTSSKIITVKAKPLADAGPDQQVCSATPSITLNGKLTNSTAPTWTGGNGNYVVDKHTLNATYTATAAEIAAGSLKLTLVNDDSLVCPAARDFMVITFVKKPAITFPAIADLCEGGAAITLSNVIPVGGVFSGTANVSAAGSLNPSAPGTFDVKYKVVLGLGCSDSVTNQVIVQPKRKADAGPDQQVCTSSPTITLNGKLTNTSTFVWVGGNGNFAPDIHTANASYTASPAELAAGSVTLTLLNTDTLVCPSVRDKIVVTYVATPVIIFPDIQTLCAGGAAVQLNPTPSGGTFSGTAQIGPTGSLNPVSAGSFTVEYRLASGPGCKDSVIKPVTVLAKPTVNAGPDQQLCTDALTISLDGQASNTSTILWKGGNGVFTPDNHTQKVSYVPTTGEIDNGKVTLTLFNTDTLVCPPAKDNIVLTIEKKPLVDAGPDQVICSGATEVQLKGSITNAPGASWSGGSGAYLSSNTAVQARYQVTAADVAAGTLTLTLVNTGSVICTPASDKMDIKIIPLPEVQLNDTGACAGITIVLKSNLANTTDISALPVVYDWQKDGVKLNGEQSSVLSVNQAGSYTVQASLGTCRTSHSAKVSYYPYPVTFLPGLYKFCDEDPKGVELDAGPGATYMWKQSGETTQKIIAHTAGTYQVVVTNQYNCPLESVTEVRSICPPRLFISSSFSPNLDGTNEKYNVYGAHFTNFKMYIFNRWGEVIYETEDRYKPWDGSYLNEPIPIGVYPWIITYEGDTHEYKGPYKKEGSVTVVR